MRDVCGRTPLHLCRPWCFEQVRRYRSCGIVSARGSTGRAARLLTTFSGTTSKSPSAVTTGCLYNRPRFCSTVKTLMYDRQAHQKPHVCLRGNSQRANAPRRGRTVGLLFFPTTGKSPLRPTSTSLFSCARAFCQPVDRALTRERLISGSKCGARNTCHVACVNVDDVDGFTVVHELVTAKRAKMH